MNLLRAASVGRSTQRRQTRLPPGSTGPAASVGSRHTLPSLAAVMSAPERRNMPLLHPQRINGGLWFGIDDCIRKDIVAAYQSNFWGPWWNFKMVPAEKKDAWWTSFVQKYYWDPVHHDLVRIRWEGVLKSSMRDRVSKRKRSGKKPDFIGLADWNTMLDTWEEEEHQKRSKTNSENASSTPDGHGSHRHTSGAKSHIRVAYDMAMEAGGEAPSIPDIVRKTHTGKDGTWIDKRAESLLLAAEELASQRSQESTETDGTTSAPTKEQLSAAYIEKATNNKGRIYGLGSIQYLDGDSNYSPAASVLRSVEVDGKMTKMEGDINGLKEDMTGVKQGITVLLKMNGIDPVTYQPIQRESNASAPSPRSEASQQLPQESM